MLEITNLSKVYKRNNKEFEAVSNINLKVNKGDFINIIGRSGSGKSTLLNILAGTLLPSSGTVKFENNLYSDMTLDELSIFRNENIGFIPQDTYLLSNFTVIENIVLPFFIHKRDGEAYEKAKDLLEELNISYLSNSYPNELSGGEQRRVLIARALINSPKLIIADEPTSDLDIENSKSVMNLLQNINKKGVTVLIVTHELDSISSNQIVYTMMDGKLNEGNTLSKNIDF